MALNKDITTAQKIVNNANYKQNFTINISSEKSVKNRYIVSCVNLYTGKNPSLQFDLLNKIDKIINNTDIFDSIGGWFNTENKTYFLDCNQHFSNLNRALQFAKIYQKTAIFDKLEDRLIYTKL